MRALSFGVLICLLTSAYALEVPQPSPKDPRVKTVVYDPDEVVQIDTYVGIGTDLVFAPGERIEKVAGGDSSSWEMVVYENDFFIKPKYEQGAANLIIRTNKRRYVLYLITHAKSAVKVSKPGKRGKKIETEPKLTDAVVDPRQQFMVVWKYPSDIASSAAVAISQAQSQQAVKMGLADIKGKLATAELERPHNYAYSMQGSQSIAPSEAYDDQVFTRFVFPANRELPAIFVVDADGNEQVVDGHPEGSTYVVHRLARKFIFRAGTKQVLAVFNDKYDGDGTSISTGTVSQDVIRAVKGSGQ